MPLTSQKYGKIITRFFAPLLNIDSDILSTLRANTLLANGERYFDFTASGLSYRAINKRIESILPYYANTHSHFASHAALMSEIYERAKEHIAEALGLSDDFVLIAGGSGASFGIKKFQELMGIYVPPRSLLHLESMLENAITTKDTTHSHTYSSLPLLMRLKNYDIQTNMLNLPHIIMSGCSSS